MVDDHTQRPYRSLETPTRNAPAKAAGSSGSDPLAELARLIGQNDPFGEFGRDGARRAVAPPTQEPPAAWADEPVAVAPAAPAASMQSFGRPNFGGAPLANDTDMYRVEGEAPGYSAATAAGYQDDQYNQNAPHLGPAEDDYYEEEQPSRKRMGILVIAGVFALAVVGTAGAFGYRALFGTSSTSGPPPVIKAETAPSKIVPAAAKDPQSGKQITDRVNDRGLGEKLVSREEQPVPVIPQDPPSSSSSMPPSLGSGVVGSEPKKIRTIAIRPDQGSSPEAAAPPPQPAQPTGRVTTVAPASRPTAIPPAQPPRPAAGNPSETDVEAASRPAAPRSASQPAQAAAPRSDNAPLSLSPDAPARSAARAAAPAPTARTASVASAPAASGGGSYLVQVSSQRSEAEAQAAFQSLQAKYPGQLGGKQAVIRKVELGDKGTYYRAMVSAGSSGEATELCTGLKAAGGSCLVQRN